MQIDACPLPGAYTRAQFRRILPLPNADIERQLRRFIRDTGLSSDATIGVRDPRLQHCILLPGPGLLLTATRTQTPLLETHCAQIARITNFPVLLLRMGGRSGLRSTSEGTGACLICHDVDGHLATHEGYSAYVPAQGGILLRHTSVVACDYQINDAGMVRLNDVAFG